MTTVQRILDAKGDKVFSVRPDNTVLDALKLMNDENVGAVVVKDGDKLVGIFTERRYARNVFLKGRSSPETFIREVMDPNVICVTPELSVEACMALMTENLIRHLPVLCDEQIVGMISIGDLVKSIIADQGIAIDHLKNYISG